MFGSDVVSYTPLYPPGKYYNRLQNVLRSLIRFIWTDLTYFLICNLNTVSLFLPTLGTGKSLLRCTRTNQNDWHHKTSNLPYKLSFFDIFDRQIVLWICTFANQNHGPCPSCVQSHVRLSVNNKKGIANQPWEHGVNIWRKMESTTWYTSDVTAILLVFVHFLTLSFLQSCVV